MIIECFGMPGAGKSTLVSQLSEGGVFHKIPSRVSRMYAFLFAARHPFFIWRFIWTAVRESARTSTWPLGRFKIAVLLNTIGRLQYARTKSLESGCYIVDEGLVQRLLSLYETKQPPEVFSRHISNIPLSDVVVRVSYVGVLFEESRVGTQRRRLGKEYEIAWREIMNHNHQSILEALDACGVPMCTYELGDHDHATILHVRECLERKIST